MIEFLISVVQGICAAGYLYGAWLVIAHGPQNTGPRQTDLAAPTATASRGAAAWHRFLAYDG